jgi:hypothetical protein
MHVSHGTSRWALSHLLADAVNNKGRCAQRPQALQPHTQPPAALEWNSDQVTGAHMESRLKITQERVSDRCTWNSYRGYHVHAIPWLSTPAQNTVNPATCI